MTFDLATARALHERCPYDPQHCTTCRTEEWPCATALALGATGRSEWTGPTAPIVAAMEAAMHPDIDATGMVIIPKTIEYDPNTERVTPDGTVHPICLHPEDHADPEDLCGADACAFREGHTSRHHTIYGVPFDRSSGLLRCATDGCVQDRHADTVLHLTDAGIWFNTHHTTTGTTIPAPICAHDHPTGRRCQRPADHDGLHRELDPVRWDDQGTIRCLITGPDNEQCDETHTHDGPHTYDKCPSLSPGGRQCQAEREHHGLHYHGPLYRWHPFPCRHTRTDQNDQPTSCVLADAHHGVCYFRSARHDTPRCHPGGSGSMTCALRAGHFGAHVTYSGDNFKDYDCDPA